MEEWQLFSPVLVTHDCSEGGEKGKLLLSLADPATSTIKRKEREAIDCRDAHFGSFKTRFETIGFFFNFFRLYNKKNAVKIEESRSFFFTFLFTV